MRSLWFALVCALAFLPGSRCPADPVIQMLVPGFSVQELPIKLSNINNLRFAPDGRLTALGYDGRIHLLEDRDGDGLEDEAKIFWGKSTLTVPVGMVWGPEGLYVSSHGKISLLRDRNQDGEAEEEEVLASGWPKTDVASGGVDAAAITRDAQGNLFFGLVTPDYSNPYRVKEGVSHYDLKSPRGTIQKWSALDRKLETIATGIRVPYSLAFNHLGDLFLTDQEGETWCPQGNPLDELNHIVPGKNYGFPPRHEKYLPDLISEAPVVGFGPQHQSTCGLIFNDPSPATQYSAGIKLFGPAWWKGNAFVAGESRGKIWRVQLVKTPYGYVGREMIIARLGMLTTDVAISPRGDLYVSCHSGPPDWGTGPKGIGKLFKISFTNPKAPQPVLAWPEKMQEIRVSFDPPLDAVVTNYLGAMRLEGGEFVSAADRFEALKPPYEVVKKQQLAPRRDLKISSVSLVENGKVLLLKTDISLRPMMNYALTIPGVRAVGSQSIPETVDIEFDLFGAKMFFLARRGWEKIRGLDEGFRQRALRAGFTSSHGRLLYAGWMPSPDLSVALALSPGHEGLRLASELIRLGAIESTSIKFSVPAAITIQGKARGPFKLSCLNAISTPIEVPAKKGKDGVYVSQVDLATLKLGQNAGGFFNLEIQSQSRTPLIALSYFTSEDPTVRPLDLQKTVLTGTERAILKNDSAPANSWVKGDWDAGKQLFSNDQLKCSTCHRVRGEGGLIGPDLSNLTHRDPDSVWRDIKDPNASINPDYVAYQVRKKNGEELTGFVRSQTENSLQLLGADGKEVLCARAEIEEARASSISLMPSGLVDGLTATQSRDLLTFLVTEPPPKAPETPSSQTKTNEKPLIVKKPVPPLRSKVEVEALLAKNTGAQPTRPLKITLVASKQDHGPGEHDYPAWQKKWQSLLSESSLTQITTASNWPASDQWENTDLFLFNFWNHQWSQDQLDQLDKFLTRGGGVLIIHAACIADSKPEVLAERIGLAAQPVRTKYRHGLLELKPVGTHPIIQGLPTLDFVDETYWPMIGNTNSVQVLGTAMEEGKEHPMLWIFEQGKGKVFGSVLGHYSTTFDDPYFRLIVLRAMAWATGESIHRFENLVTHGIQWK